MGKNLYASAMFSFQQEALSVSAITDLIKRTLEESFYGLTVEGEISNFRPASSGHWYFTLKDEQAAISCVMFKNSTFRMPFRPKDGMQVSVTGNISVYRKRGSYQIICESMKQVGEGAILLMLEERKRKLAAEGLFDPQRKRQLPMLPSCIGVITSPTGAALRDILQVLKRRNAGIRVLVFPAAVQGEQSPAQLIRQVERANSMKNIDALIIGRGGGSLEDLLPFSDEGVVRAVAASRIPVISAVGHEIDWALTDFAADLRAPTPSAAAELVSSEREQILLKVRTLKEQIAAEISSRLGRARLMIDAFSPENFRERFAYIMAPLIQLLDDEREELRRNVDSLLREKRQNLAILRSQLEAQSPLAVLDRGYAVVTDSETGRVIRSAEQCAADQSIDIRLRRGSLLAEVKESRHEDI